MMSSEVESEDRRGAWLKSLASELEKTQQFLPSFIEPGENCPDWVFRVEREIGDVMLPLVKIKDEGVITPKRMGSVLGHICAMAVWTLDWLMVKGENERDGDYFTIEVLPDKCRFDKWYNGMRRVAKKALCSSVDQTFEDMSEFLVGYSNAFARKPRTFKVGDFGNPTFEIYLFMLMFWRLVVRLQSVSHLHELLTKVFGAHRIGELKRIEKICQRIGLHYRKPGRPKK